uniref:RGS domain-containing protein n=1 Tax=Heterorhabditis bacteriophora TaxID=37862 RepID=A0A1I7XDA3_HETBA
MSRPSSATFDEAQNQIYTLMQRDSYPRLIFVVFIVQKYGTYMSDQPLGLLCEVARRELIHLFESMPASKDLIVDPSLLRPLDRIASMSLLQKHGCVRVLPLKQDTSISWDSSVARRVYLVRPSLDMARLIAEHIRCSPDKQIAVIWANRRLAICDRELERQGVFGLIEVFELSISMISLESDLFSLELPTHISMSDLFTPAQALFQLQSLYGLIPTVYGIGEQSEKMWKLVHHIYMERGEPRSSPDQPVSHLFIFDRSLDHASIFLTGLTYESLLHDTFTIGCGKISFGAEVESKLKPDGDADSSSRKSKIYVLDNNDGVFASVRNKHMTGVFSFLSSKAKEIQTNYDKGASIDQVRDMKQFVAHELKALKLQHRQLEMHICACEVLLEKSGAIGASERFQFEHELVSGTANISAVMSYLEDCMLREQSPWQVLSLVCLTSLTQNGLLPKQLHSFREHFLRAYGFDYLPILHSLISKRLIMEKSTISVSAIAQGGKPSSVGLYSTDSIPTLPFLIKRLNLTPSCEELPQDLRNPTSMSYVFSGAFTPPLCQVVANTMVNGWNTLELKKTFGGRVFVEENSYMPADCRPDNRMRKAILVFFLGGVTYAEIAALRLLAVQNNFRILVATTNIAPRLYTKFGSELYIRVKKHLPLLEEEYKPTWWCPFGTAQTIVRQLFRDCPRLPFIRELIDFDDGGVVGIDWLLPEGCAEDAPIVVFLPGITGSTHECSYILHPALEAWKHNWRSVVVNPRGLGGVELRTKRTYNAASCADISEVLKRITHRYPKAKKIGCGFSMGGMILWNYLAKHTAESVNLDGAMIISSPFNPHTSSTSIERFIPRIIFNRFLTNNLIKLVSPYRHLFTDIIDFDHVLSSRTVRQFDTRFVALLFGYKSCDDYYNDAALHHKVQHIPIPTVCLTSIDDCFCPVNSLPLEEMSKSETVVGVVTAHGGHTAFMEDAGVNANGLVEKLLSQWGNMIFYDKY